MKYFVQCSMIGNIFYANEDFWGFLILHNVMLILRSCDVSWRTIYPVPLPARHVKGGKRGSWHKTFAVTWYRLFQPVCAYCTLLVLYMYTCPLCQWREGSVGRDGERYQSHDTIYSNLCTLTALYWSCTCPSCEEREAWAVKRYKSLDIVYSNLCTLTALYWSCTCPLCEEREAETFPIIYMLLCLLTSVLKHRKTENYHIQKLRN